MGFSKAKTYVLGFVSILLIIFLCSNTGFSYTDLSELTTLHYRRARRSQRNAAAYNVYVENISGETFEISLKVVIESITPSCVTVENADGYTKDGKPYFDYSSLLNEGQLGPGEVTGTKTWIFSNPKRTRFRFTTKVIGEVQSYAADINPENITIDTESGSKIAGDQLIIFFKDDISFSDAENLIKNHNLQIVGKLLKFRSYQVLVPAGVDVNMLKEELQSNTLIASVEYNYIADLNSVEPDDYYFNPPPDKALLEQWNLKKIGMPEAWEITKGSSSNRLAIAVLDTGVDSTIEDLDSKILEGANINVLYSILSVPLPTYTEPDPLIENPTTSDQFEYNMHIYHGTMVAGIAAAETNNEKCIAGVAWKNKIIPFKIGATSPGVFNINAALDEAIKRNIKIVNISAGTNFLQAAGMLNVIKSLEDLVQEASQKGILIITGTANEEAETSCIFGLGDCGSWPAVLAAKYDNVISVAASDENDNFFLGYGAEITVAAPGAHIPVLSWYKTPENEDCSHSVSVNSGTSFAAPQVAGVAALIWSLDYEQDGDFDLSPSQVKNIIAQTALEDVVITHPDTGEKFGRLNAYKALTMAKDILSANYGPNAKYFTIFNSQGSWIDDTHTCVDEPNSRLFWSTNASYSAAYDSISAQTQVGDVIDFEYRYISHNDENTKQIVRFGFTDGLPYSSNSDPNNFIGGFSTNYNNKAQSGVKLIKNGKVLFSWSQCHTKDVPTTFRFRIHIVSSSEFNVLVFEDGSFIDTETINDDATGIFVNKCAVWNGEAQDFPIQGTYSGQFNYIYWVSGGSDTEPPQLLDIEISPRKINATSSPGKVDLKIHVTDDLSGFSFAIIQFQSSHDQVQWDDVRIGSRISGCALDGWYPISIEFPMYCEAGTWRLNITLVDASGNGRQYSATDLEAKGFPATVQVLSEPDMEGPQLVDLSFTPNCINVTSGSQNVDITFHVTDNISGLSNLAVFLWSPSGTQKQWVDEWIPEGTSPVRISGNKNDGYYKVTLTFPQNSETGTWSLSMILRDMVGNEQIFDSESLQSQGFPVELQVTSTPDTSPPELKGLDIEPRMIDTSSNSKTVTVSLHIADDISGFSHGVILFQSPSSTHSKSVSFSVGSVLSGNANDGHYESVITFPQYSEYGEWSLTLTLVDQTGNTLSLSTSDLENKGFPSRFYLGDKINTLQITEPTCGSPLDYTQSFKVKWMDLSYYGVDHYVIEHYFHDKPSDIKSFTTNSNSYAAAWSESDWGYCSSIGPYYVRVTAYRSDGSILGGPSDWCTIELNPVVTSVTLNGPSSVSENSLSDYTLIAHFSNGSSQDVTSSASWSENSSYCYFASPGRLVIQEVPSDQTVTITASYKCGEITNTGNEIVKILDNNHQDNTTPSVYIKNPSDGSTYAQGQFITFQGAGFDEEDSWLYGSSLIWTSSIDGQIGTGTEITVNSLSLGTHTITLTGIDSGGASGTASINITISSSYQSSTIKTLLDRTNNPSGVDVATVTISGNREISAGDSLNLNVLIKTLPNWHILDQDTESDREATALVAYDETLAVKPILDVKAWNSSNFFYLNSPSTQVASSTFIDFVSEYGKKAVKVIGVGNSSSSSFYLDPVTPHDKLQDNFDIAEGADMPDSQVFYDYNSSDFQFVIWPFITGTPDWYEQISFPLECVCKCPGIHKIHMFIKLFFQNDDGRYNIGKTEFTIPINVMGAEIPANIDHIYDQTNQNIIAKNEVAAEVFYSDIAPIKVGEMKRLKFTIVTKDVWHIPDSDTGENGIIGDFQLAYDESVSAYLVYGDYEKDQIAYSYDDQGRANSIYKYNHTDELVQELCSSLVSRGADYLTSSWYSLLKSILDPMINWNFYDPSLKASHLAFSDDDNYDSLAVGIKSLTFGMNPFYQAKRLELSFDVEFSKPGLHILHFFTKILLESSEEGLFTGLGEFEIPIEVQE